jgi:hypothetical protein
MGDLITIFPDPSAERLWQTKELLEKQAVWRRFLGYKIVPSFTIFDQKRAPNGHEHGRKGGFFRPHFSKACQVS